MLVLLPFYSHYTNISYNYSYTVSLSVFFGGTAMKGVYLSCADVDNVNEIQCNNSQV